jgi:hypothetical protein
MALTETKVIDKIEVMQTGHIQVREAIKILKDGEVIAQNFHRFTVAPGESTQDMDTKVVAICAAVHTPEVITAYQAEQARLAEERAAQAAAQQPA